MISKYQPRFLLHFLVYRWIKEQTLDFKNLGRETVQPALRKNTCNWETYFDLFLVDAYSYLGTSSINASPCPLVSKCNSSDSIKSRPTV